MHDDLSGDHELVFEETDALASLKTVYQEFCARREAFWAQREEFPLGYPAYVLAALLEDLAAFDLRFAKFKSPTKQLEAAHRPALRERLSEIEADCKRNMSLIQDMHEDRVASEREALGIAPKSNKGVLDTLGHVSRGLRHALGMDKAE